MAKKTKNQKRTAAANAARRKQGPTKRTDYKNGKAVTAAAKKKGGSKSKSSGGGGGRASGGGGRSSSTSPGGSSGGRAASKAHRTDAANRASALDKEVSGLQKKRSMSKNPTERAALAQKISQTSARAKLNKDIAMGKRDSSGAKVKRKVGKTEQQSLDYYSGKGRRFKSAADAKQFIKLANNRQNAFTTKAPLRYKVATKKGIQKAERYLASLG